MGNEAIINSFICILYRLFKKITEIQNVIIIFLIFLSYLHLHCSIRNVLLFLLTLLESGQDFSFNDKFRRTRFSLSIQFNCCSSLTHVRANSEDHPYAVSHVDLSFSPIEQWSKTKTLLKLIKFSRILPVPNVRRRNAIEILRKISLKALLPIV